MVNHHPECRACAAEDSYDRCRSAMQNSVDAIRDVAIAVRDIDNTIESIDDSVACKEQLRGRAVLLYAAIDEVITSTDVVFCGIINFANSVNND